MTTAKVAKELYSFVGRLVKAYGLSIVFLVCLLEISLALLVVVCPINNQ